MRRGKGRAGWSLASRLTVAYAASAFLLILGATVALDAELSTTLEHDLAHELLDEVLEIEMVLDRPDWLVFAQQESFEEAQEVPPILLRVQRADGTVELQSPVLEAVFPADPVPVLAPANGLRASRTGTLWNHVRRIASARGETYVIEGFVERTDLAEFLARYRGRAAIVLACALVACLAGAHVLARRGLRPIARATEAARRVTSKTIGAERIDIRRAPAEIAELAETINAMLDRLDAAFHRMRDLGADLAHELRTPVHNLRGEAEVALLKDRTPAEYRAVLEGVLEECERFSRLIDDVLLIERTEARGALELVPVNIVDELESLRAYFEPGATARSIALVCDVPRSAPIEALADRVKLRRALGNLVDNALKYTPEGGRVTLSARAREDGVEIEVADTGPGIPPEELPRVFDRFYRCEKSRARAGGGVGLGLAIARTLVRAHGGDVVLESELGRGTRAVVRLPREDPREDDAFVISESASRHAESVT